MEEKTKNDFEHHLNKLYSDTYSRQEFIKHFIYLAATGRTGGTCSVNKIANAFTEQNGGSLLRKYDSITFHTLYREWVKEN